MLIEGKLLSSGEDLSEAYDIRKKVFIEELGLLKNLVFDEYDNLAIHAVVFQGLNQHKAIATGRIFYDGEICWLGLIAVLKEYRGNQYGDFIVRLLINKAFTSGITNINVKVLKCSWEFFKKIGFKQDSEEFIELGSKMIIMNINRKDVSIPCNSNIN